MTISKDTKVQYQYNIKTLNAKGTLLSKLNQADFLRVHSVNTPDSKSIPISYGDEVLISTEDNIYFLSNKNNLSFDQSVVFENLVKKDALRVCRWMILPHNFERNRIQFQIGPVKLNEKVLIKNCITGKYLCLGRTVQGGYEISCDGFLCFTKQNIFWKIVRN